MVKGQSPFGIPTRDREIPEVPEIHFDIDNLVAEPVVPRQIGSRPAPASPPAARSGRQRRRHHRRGLLALSALLGLIAITSGGVGAWYLLKAEPSGPSATSEAVVPTQQESDASTTAIRSRSVDPEPLGRAELFGDGPYLPEPAEDYALLDSQTQTDCGLAANPGLRSALREADCRQVVRAVVTDPSEQYLITIGAADVSDDKAADRLRDKLDAEQDGGLRALRAPGVAGGLGTSGTVLGYNAFGHYLLYAVIGRTDGAPTERENSATREQVPTLVDDYLVERLEPRTR